MREKSFLAQTVRAPTSDPLGVLFDDTTKPTFLCSSTVVMKLSITHSLVLCALLACSSPTNAIKRFSISKILELEKRGVSTNEKEEHDDPTLKDANDVQELFLEQRLDHFTAYPNDDTPTNAPYNFSQRFFYTTRYIRTENESNNLVRRTRTGTKVDSDVNAPTYAFICVGGEGPALDKSVLTNSVHCSGDMLALARILSSERNANVHVFALEHRYYGNSYPEFKDKSSPVANENLKFLSSRQALADLAHFVQFARDEYGIANNVPFVTFGGSYPGMLAAWSRLKYPHLIHAAVSNSAPLEVILDFSEYMNVYAKSISNPAVGGSPACLDILHQGHEDIATILSHGGQEGKEQIASLFNLCNGAHALEDEKSLNSFVGNGVVFFDVQSNDPSCDDDLCNIEKFCTFITDEAATNETLPMEILAKLSNMMDSGDGDGDGDDCKDISWEGMISFLSSDKAMVDGTRSWLWQTCTEVGFYQTCEHNSTCPFARGHHTLDADLEICQRAFGIDADFVEKNVEDTLNYYGGWDISSSHILSVNGDIDPWSAMSYSNSGREDVDLPSYWSVGSSHHYWTHEVKQSDGIGIMRARAIIYDWVIWVLEASDGEHDAVLSTQ